RWPRDWSSDVCSSDLSVERRLLAHDVRDLGGLGVGLGQAARVVGGPALAGAHSVHTSTSLSYGSYVSISWSMMARMPTSSEAIATRLSDSYSTSGFAAISSLATPSASLVTTM